MPVPAEELDGQGGETVAEYLFEPDVQGVLEAILPHYIAFQLFQMALNARASEHSARMVAMKNATDNAKELIKDLPSNTTRFAKKTSRQSCLKLPRRSSPLDSSEI